MTPDRTPTDDTRTLQQEWNTLLTHTGTVRNLHVTEATRWAHRIGYTLRLDSDTPLKPHQLDACLPAYAAAAQCPRPEAAMIEHQGGSAHLHLATRPLPTSSRDLADLLDNRPCRLWWWLRTLLGKQLDDQHAADSLFCEAEHEACHRQDIDRARRTLPEALTAAATALARAQHALDELTGPLYDVEYVESPHAPHMETFGQDAQRALAAMLALNPCDAHGDPK